MTDAATTPAILLRGVSKSYRKDGEVIEALAGVDLEIAGRSMVAVVGPSGSGKSTLLHLVGGMDTPTEGEVIVAGQAVNRLPPGELTRFRRQTVGFVFQSFNLIPNLTALENVALPMEFNGVPKAARLARAKALLERFQLGHRLKHHPRELSGGEMQRVAIARAVANEPRLVLADEPTGNLDSRSGQLIYELLQELSRERTVLVVTHAEDLARLAARVIHIRDGRLLDAPTPTLGVREMTGCPQENGHA
jgi:ABC-type lipoprotein export system ATPase subunit